MCRGIIGTQGSTGGAMTWIELVPAVVMPVVTLIVSLVSRVLSSSTAHSRMEILRVLRSSLGSRGPGMIRCGEDEASE